MKIKLGSGKLIELVDTYGPRQSLRAAELTEISGEMTYAQSMLLNYATVMVAVKNVDGKSIEDVTQGAIQAKEMLLRFREAFTDKEWMQLNTAFDQVYGDPKDLDAFEILS